MVDLIDRQAHWIPCSERLPETNGKMYLVTISEGSKVYVSALQWDTNQKIWYLAIIGDEEICYYHFVGVIAWSAVPEPYKE